MPTPPDFKLTSDAFAEGEAIPSRYTCDGAGYSPQLSWENPPEGAQTFALIMHDPDAPGGNFVHWVLNLIPPETRSLASSPAGEVGVGASGLNSAGRQSYVGPCPPSGQHRYYFTLYALDITMLFEEPPDAELLTKSMQGHILGQTALMGTYQR